MYYKETQILGAQVDAEDFHGEWRKALKPLSASRAVERVLQFSRSNLVRIGGIIENKGKYLDVRLYNLAGKAAMNSIAAYEMLLDVFGEARLAKDFPSKMSLIVSNTKKIGDLWGKVALMDVSEMPLYTPRKSPHESKTPRGDTSRFSVDTMNGGKKVPTGLIAAGIAGVAALYFSLR